MLNVGAFRPHGGRLLCIPLLRLWRSLRTRGSSTVTGVACVGAGYALVGSGILTPGFVFGHAWSSGRRLARSTAEHTAARGFTFIRRGLVRCGLPGLILIGRYGRSTSLFLIRAGRTGLGVSCAAYAYSAAKQHDCKKPVHKASLQLDATLRHCSASDLQSTANKKAAPQRRQRAKREPR